MLQIKRMIEQKKHNLSNVTEITWAEINIVQSYVYVSTRKKLYNFFVKLIFSGY